MKNQKGITLVALVVTIVILLILAGVSLAMLTGENGIITNAQKAKAGNTEADVIERMGLAYSTAKTEAMVQMALTTGYQPNGTVTTGEGASAVTTDYGRKLAEVVAKELGLTLEADATEAGVTPGYKVTYDATNDTITMTYEDTTFNLNVGDAPANNKYPKLVGVISLTSTTVQYTTQPTSTVE